MAQTKPRGTQLKPDTVPADRLQASDIDNGKVLSAQDSEPGGLTWNTPTILGAVPVGTIIIHPRPVSTPLIISAGGFEDIYLRANGDAISRTEYSELFNMISTVYGSGDGSTTFNLPDLTERFVYGAETPNIENGQTGGFEEITLVESQIPSHSHRYDRDSGSINVEPSGVTAVRRTTSSTGSTQPSGGGLPHNNMPPYIRLGYWILAQRQSIS